VSVALAEEIKALHDELAQLRRQLETARSSAACDTRRRILAKLQARVDSLCKPSMSCATANDVSVYRECINIVKEDGPT
jgi:hypothetical protein